MWERGMGWEEDYGRKGTERDIFLSTFEEGFYTHFSSFEAVGKHFQG
jgi:hypothetical protein